MDSKQIKEFIKTVAEIKERKPVRNASHGRVEKEWVTEIDPATGEEIEVERNVPLENDTLGFDLVKIKPQNKLCELGCGEIVTDQVIEKRLADYPKKHWKTRCKNCQLYLTPDGEGLVKSTEINAYYIKWFNAVKSQETKTSDPKKPHEEYSSKTLGVVDGQAFEETVTNEAIIRRFL